MFAVTNIIHMPPWETENHWKVKHFNFITQESLYNWARSGRLCSETAEMVAIHNSYTSGPIYTGTTLSYETSLRPWRQAYDLAKDHYTRTIFSLTKLNMEKFAPGFSERKL